MSRGELITEAYNYTVGNGYKVGGRIEWTESRAESGCDAIGAEDGSYIVLNCEHKFYNYDTIDYLTPAVYPYLENKTYYYFRLTDEDNAPEEYIYAYQDSRIWDTNIEPYSVENKDYLYELTSKTGVITYKLKGAKTLGRTEDENLLALPFDESTKSSNVTNNFYNPLFSPCLILYTSNGFLRELFDDPYSYFTYYNANISYLNSLNAFKEKYLGKISNCYTYFAYPASEENYHQFSASYHSYKSLKGEGQLIETPHLSYQGQLCKLDETHTLSKKTRKNIYNIIFFPNLQTNGIALPCIYNNIFTSPEFTSQRQASPSSSNPNVFTAKFSLPILEEQENYIIKFPGQLLNSDGDLVIQEETKLLYHDFGEIINFSSISDINKILIEYGNNDLYIKFYYHSSPSYYSINNGFYIIVEKWKNGTVYDV